MKTPLDYFYDGCDKWYSEKYNYSHKSVRTSKHYNDLLENAIKYMLGKLNEKNTTKTKSKANAKSKLKNGKQVKSLLKAKKRVPTK